MSKKGAASQRQATPACLFCEWGAEDYEAQQSMKMEEHEMKAFHEVRNYDSDLMVWQASYQNISFLAHWHQEVELIYVCSGQARFCVNDDEFTARAGDLVYVDTGDFHYSDSGEYENCLSFIVLNPGVIGSHYHHAHFIHPLITGEMLKTYHMEQDVLRLFSQVNEELTSRQAYYPEIVSAMLREFIFRLRRRHPRMDEATVTRSHRLDTLSDMQQLLTYIDEHYGEDLTLASAAEKMNLSESHFSRTFKKLVGLNYVTYLNAVRIEQAAGLIRDSGKKITDIALSCGFGNIRSFNRTFKEYTGYTPTQFLNLPDSSARNFSFYKRKLDRKEYVRNDSLTLVKNLPG